MPRMAQLIVSSHSYGAVESAIKPEYSSKICQLFEALYSKFHPGGWAVTPMAK